MEQELPFNLPSQTLAAMRPKRVCLCMGLSEQDLIDSIRKGNRSFEKLQDATGCSTGCGCCELEVLQLIEETLKHT